MLGFGLGELVLIGLITLILFGDKNLPSNLRKFAKWVSTARGVATEAQKSWLDVKSQVARSLLNEDEKEPIEKNGLLKTLDPITNPIGLEVENGNGNGSEPPFIQASLTPTKDWSGPSNVENEPEKRSPNELSAT